VEPFLVPGETKDDIRVFVPEVSTTSTTTDTNSKPGAKEEADEGKNKTGDQNDASSSAPLSEETQAAEYIPGDLVAGGQEEGAADPQSTSQSTSQSTVFSTTETGPPKDGPLEKILQTEKPPEETENKLDIPHLHPAPYVHNFDSYTLVKEVEKGGYTPEQAITAMKAVRMLLSENLEIAKKGLVSKSDVENVSFVIVPEVLVLALKIRTDHGLTHSKVTFSARHAQNSGLKSRILGRPLTRR
jgi:hypothetical protein